MGQEIGGQLSGAIPSQIPSSKLELSADMINLTSGLAYKVTLDTVPAAYTDGVEDTVNNRIVIPKDGFYHIVGNVTFYNIIAAAIYESWITINAGVINTSRNYQHASVGGAGIDITCWTILPNHFLGVGDFVYLYCQQNSGVNTVDVNRVMTYLGVQRVR